MNNPKHVNFKIDAPLKGVIRKTAYQDQPPFSCFSAVNMWPVDAKTGRTVSAPRPALQALPVPTGKNKCNMLCRVNGVETSKPIQGLVAAFDSDVYYWNESNNWTAATGAQASSIETGRTVFSTPFLQNAIIFSGSASPLVFEYGAATVTELVESEGTAPQGAKFGHVFQGALFVAGETGNEHILYQSRVGDFTDWDYGVSSDDTGGAWFSGVDDSGLLNGPVTAILSANNDRILISTLEGIVQMAALPRQGGVFDVVSKQYVLGQGAWCKGPDDTLYMMTPAGFTILAPSPGAVPALVSRNLIPEELIGLRYNYDNPVVSMAYDTRWNLVIITVRDLEQQAWAYDPVLGGFHRMEFNGGYPYLLLEYPPFIGEQTSGVVFAGGGSRPVARFDKFGTETFSTKQIVGPVQISTSSLNKSMIDKLRFVLHRDSPGASAEGVVRIACGTDGQDAINRLLINDTTRTFTVPLSFLHNNNGLCYPKVAGNAVAFEIEQTVGGVSWECADLVARDAGSEKGMRSTQLEVTGGPVTFDEPTNDFDADLWHGYSQATPDDPCDTLTDTTILLDLDGMPASWWAVVKPDGRDIRVTDVENVQVPHDLISFDYDNKRGLLAFKMTQTIPARPVRVWVGANVGALPANDTYGQYNAYDANTIGFWPAGGGNDRTSNENHFIMSGATAGGTTGPLGSSPATDYGGNTNWYGVANAVVPSAHPLTLMVAANRAAATTTERGAFGLHKAGASPTTNAFISPVRNPSSPNNSMTRITTTVTTSESALTSDSGSSPYQWTHHAGTVTSATARAAFVNGAFKQSDTNSITLEDLDEIVIGKGSRSALSSNSFQGVLALASLANVVRSDCWIAYQAAMLDQANFWNGWGEFEEVNPLPEPTEPDDAACPTYPAPMAETGTWSGYAEATPIPTIAANEIDWTHLIDLSKLPNDWWSAVLANGQDIRATDGQNKFIPLDLIEFDKSGKTGLAAVKLSQSTTPQPIRLWVGNSDAIALNPCATYGKYQAYDEWWAGFWPAGGGEDRTQFLQHMTAYPSASPPDVGGETGPIGNTATDYDGVGDFCLSQVKTNAPYPLTLIAVVDHNADNGTPPNSPNNRAMIGVASMSLQWLYDEQRAAIIHKFRPGGAFTESSAPTPGTWRVYSGHVETLGRRAVYIDGDDFDSDVYQTTGMYEPPSNYPVIGASARSVTPGTLGTATESEIVTEDHFYGSLSLVSMHSKVRSPEWVQYFAAMMDQDTFWDSAWAWTADSNTLPQT